MSPCIAPYPAVLVAAKASGEPVEARLVAAIGESNPVPRPRRQDDNRRKGFTASAMPGTQGPWDKGHFIGHAIGGTVDGNEANVFLQLRSANRGRYREMEKYCIAHAGVTCFSRPVYTDTSIFGNARDNEPGAAPTFLRRNFPCKTTCSPALCYLSPLRSSCSRSGWA